MKPPPRPREGAAAPKAERARRPGARARLEVDERRAQLLAIGVRAFSERPFEEVSIDAIAAEAGISKGLLYHYFPTKHGFYVEALRVIAGDLVAAMPSADAHGSPEERLRRGLDTYLAFVERRSRAYVALMRSGHGAEEGVAEVLEATRSTIEARIAEHLPTPAAHAPLLRAALRGFLGFVEAMALDWATRRDVPREELVELAATVLVDSMRAAALLWLRRG